MYFQSGATGQEPSAPIPVGMVTRLTIALLVAAIFVLGVYPMPALSGALAKPVAATAAAREGSTGVAEGR